MKAEKISAILKFISIVFFALFILLMIFSIVSYTNKKIFITLLTLFLLFIIPFFIFYKYSVKIYSKNSYKKIKENKEKLNHIPLNYSILKDYQKAILELKELDKFLKVVLSIEVTIAASTPCPLTSDIINKILFSLK